MNTQNAIIDNLCFIPQILFEILLQSQDNQIHPYTIPRVQLNCIYIELHYKNHKHL